MTLVAGITAGFQSVAADIKELNGLVMTPAERAVLDDLSGALDSIEQRADAAIASAALAASSAEAATDAVSAVTASLDNKQDSLVDGVNLKTINGHGLVGSGNVVLTKADFGLGIVENTSDVDKPVSTATQAALDTKVDKEVGKQLSTEDYTSAEKTKLAGVEDGANAYTHPDNHPASVITQDEDNRFVTDVEKASWNAKQDTLVSGDNIKTLNGESLLGSGDLVVAGGGEHLNYTNRDDLRSRDPEENTAVQVERLGMFVYKSSTPEPDDDETCFRIPGKGAWLLQNPHFDLINSYLIGGGQMTTTASYDLTTTAASIGSFNAVTQTFENNIGVQNGDAFFVLPNIEIDSRLSFRAYSDFYRRIKVEVRNNSNSTVSLPAGKAIKVVKYII